MQPNVPPTPTPVKIEGSSSKAPGSKKSNEKSTPEHATKSNVIVKQTKFNKKGRHTEELSAAKNAASSLVEGVFGGTIDSSECESLPDIGQLG